MLTGFNSIPSSSSSQNSFIYTDTGTSDGSHKESSPKFQGSINAIDLGVVTAVNQDKIEFEIITSNFIKEGCPAPLRRVGAQARPM